MKKRPVVIVGNPYRRQLFAPFVLSRAFGTGPHLYLEVERVLEATGLRRLWNKLLLSCAEKLILSDGAGAEVLANYAIPGSKSILWFGWNGAQELRSWDMSRAASYRHLSFCLLFSNEATKCSEMFSIGAKHLRTPVLATGPRRSLRHMLSYLGEVDVNEKLESDNSSLHRQLWSMAEQWVHGVRNKNDASRLREHLGAMPPEQASWILRNRIRYLYIIFLKKSYGKDFVLVGDDWKRYGLDSLPTNYDSQSRLELYSRSKLCVDLLSKSSSEAHYPRSAEIVSHSHGIVQMEAADGREFLGDQYDLRAFSSLSDLKATIDRLLEMKDNELTSLGCSLRKRLVVATQAFNAIQLQGGSSSGVCARHAA
jgi:hypothetical protein